MNRYSRQCPMSISLLGSLPGKRVAIVAAFMAIASLPGCRLSTGSLSPNPRDFDQQVEEILEIVPLNTDRAEAIRKLEEAGVEGSFGISQSTYYCDSWRQKNGKRVLMDVALLFDNEGKLYSTRNSQASMALDYTKASPSPAVKTSSERPSKGLDTPHSAPKKQASSYRSRSERTPFRDTLDP